MKYGLKENIIDQIKTVFENYAEVEEVIPYGSRAKGDFSPNSDIDLTLIGNRINIEYLNNLIVRLFT